MRTPSGPRFAFGNNWRNFLETVDDERIAEAERSLREMLGVTSLDNQRFLDAGCGSGLFSLAALRMGASVHSFDFDPASVATTIELRRRYARGDSDWIIELGSVLNAEYISGLGLFDVVYSWGVLHHTGAQWMALETVQRAVAPGGRLFIALYNDQGLQSVAWRGIKRVYNHLPGPLRRVYAAMFGVIIEGASLGAAMVRGRPVAHARSRLNYRTLRGMSWWHDLVDWVGGYPFEVSSREQVVAFLRERGYEVVRIQSAGSKLGCNEFVFERLRTRVRLEAADDLEEAGQQPVHSDEVRE